MARYAHLAPAHKAAALGSWTERCGATPTIQLLYSPMKKRLEQLLQPLEKSGGAERDRTVGLLNAIQALSQLSYSPTHLQRKAQYS